MDLPLGSHCVYVFGRYRLDPVRRALLRDAAPIALPPRLFDTLLYLVENAGRVVEHDEMLRAVWGGRVVEGANIKQTIFSLRKALQADGATDRFIVTAPMRGYQFTGPVHVESGRAIPPSRAAPFVPEWRSKWRARLLWAVVPSCAMACAAWIWLDEPRPPPAHSVAVMPFSNVADGAQDYFSDGVSAELTSALSRISGLHVAARNSAFAFKGRSIRLAEMARLLNVGAILEGSIGQSGGRVRLTVDLVDAGTGFALWSHSYERSGGDVLHAQEEIAGAVAAALHVALPADDAARLDIGGTTNARAFDLYLHGMALLDRAGESAPRQRAALAEFDQAIGADPHFALARAHRAHVLTLIADGATAGHGLADARAEAERAIAIAPDLAGGHLARGSILLATQDFAGADREISLARDLAPGDATVLLSYADMQIGFGHVAAGVKAASKAASLDPLTPMTYVNLAGVLTGAGQYDAARAAISRAGILGSDLSAHDLLASIALRRGDDAAAARACALAQSWEDIFCLAIAEWALDRPDQARRRLDELRARLGDDAAYQYAEIYAQWGQPRDALRWLATAARLHDPGLVSLKSDSLLDPIRATASFRQIEQDLHFPA